MTEFTRTALVRLIKAVSAFSVVFTPVKTAQFGAHRRSNRVPVWHFVWRLRIYDTIKEINYLMTDLTD